MSKIIYHPDVMNNQTFDNVTFESWFLSLPIKPRNIRIYKDGVEEENDISELWLENPSLLEDDDATYHVVVIPMGSTFTKIFKILDPVTNWLMKALMPKTNAGSFANVRQTSANNSLTGRSNEVRLGSRIADVRGTVRIVPDLLMDYKIFQDNIEYEVQYLCGSVGELVESDIRDGDTPFINISGSVINKYRPYTSPGNGVPSMNIGGLIDVNRYPVMIAVQSNEIDGPELKPSNYYDLKKLKLKMYPNGNVEVLENPSIDMTVVCSVGSTVSLTDCYVFVENLPVGSGLYTRYSLNGSYTVSFTDQFTVGLTPLNSNWDKIPPAGFNMLQSAYLNSDGTWSLTSGSTKVNFDPTFIPVRSYLVGPYTLQNSPEIMVSIVALNGLYKQNDNIYPTSVVCELIVSNGDNPSDPEMTYNLTIYGRDTNSAGATLRITNPYPINAQISMRRLTPTDKGFDGSVVDEIKWRDLYAVTPIPVRDYGNVTTYHTLTRATDAALRLKERKLNMNATRLVDNVASNLISDVVKSMHVDPYFGRRTLETLDIDSLVLSMQQVSNYYDSDAVRVGYTFDADNITYEESLKAICAAACINPIQIGNIISFWADLPQSNSSMQFGHVSKVPNTDKRTRSFKPQKDYTGVQVTYFNFNTRVYEDYIEGESINLLKISNTGYISRKQARWKALREWSRLKFQRITHTFDALAVGLQCIPGMRADVIDNTRNMRSEGFIMAQDGLMLTLSDPIASDLSLRYTIVLTKKNGSIQSSEVDVIDEYNVVLKSQLSEQVYTGFKRDRTAYNIATEDQRSAIAMLITDVNPNNDDGNYRVAITAINYTDDYWPK